MAGVAPPVELAGVIAWRLVDARRVDGIPKGQPRPRAFVDRRTGTARVHDSGTAEGWKGDVARAFAGWYRSPIEGAVRLDLVVELPRPKRLMRRGDPDGPVPCVGKPDLDNAWKAIADALTHLGIWRDDAQIVETHAATRYHAKTGRAGAWIALYVEATP